MQRLEPIAVVSMACRMPGGIESPDEYWEWLLSGDDTGEELRDIELFDAGFFDISPRDAHAMEPQQRIVLEVVWEAFERAGIRPGDSLGTGVYLGTGVTASRVSRALGLLGPAATAEFVAALRLACAALRDGECDLAIAGEATMDGCGLLTLKLLSAARRDRDPVLAVLPDGQDYGLAEVLKVVLTRQHENDQPRRRPPDPDVGLPIVVSGRSVAARAANAERLAEYLLRHADAALADVALSAASRTQFEHRGTVFADDVTDAVQGLLALSAGAERPGVVFDDVAEYDWESLSAQRIPIPAYAFQRDRFWVTAGAGLHAAGLEPLPHPWLRAVTTTADGEGFLFTGQLSLSSQPWLADHVMFGTVVVPGTALLELALNVAQQVGAVGVGELALAAPLALSEADSVHLRVTVGALAVDGRRPVAVHSQRREDWTLHASGHLIDDPVADGGDGTADLAGATVIEPADLYAGRERLGLRYGPAFRGLVEVRRLGSVAHGRVRLPARPGGYSVDPALLDSAVHVLAALDDGPELLVPGEWRGVESRPTTTTELRVRVELTSDRTARMWLADGHGHPVAYVDELRLRTASVEQVRGSEPVEHLYRVAFESVEAVAGTAVDQEIVDLTAVHDADVPESVGQTAVDALLLLQKLLAEPRLAAAELVFLTTGGLPGAPVQGLVRSVREEHPERSIRLIELGQGATPAALDAAIATAEPELVVTGDEVAAPRLVPVDAVDWAAAPVLDPDGTVLITGGTGELGRLVARHLVLRYGLRHLLLTSRRGPDAPDVDELIDELLAAGAHQVTVRACDMADRADVAATLTTVHSEHPLVAVLHLAGVLDDRLVAGQDPKRFARVLAPKVAGAWHLHTLTQDQPLAAFVLFSSLSSVLGSAGQSNDAAANAFLDALATHRHASGLVATSLSWGLWEESGTGMTAHLGDAELARLARQGIAGFSPRQGLKAFDAALAVPEPHLVPVRLDPVCRGGFGAGGAPLPLLSGLVRAPAAGDAPPLWDRLAALPEAKRLDAVTQLVRLEAAVVLGAEVEHVGAREVLYDAGLDSLMAVELRQRLTFETGVALSATLVVDYPTPVAIARLILARLTPAAEPSPPAPDATEIGVLATAGPPAGDGERFDATFFGISAARASTLSARERLLLEAAWAAFEQAGITRQALERHRVGVFLDGGAGLVASTFGLRGPAISVDAGESSAQVATTLATDALRNDECDLALAGGLDRGLAVLKRQSTSDQLAGGGPAALPAYPVVLSGLDHTALRHQAVSWADWLDTNPDVALPALAWTAAMHRTHFDCRAAIAAPSVDELRVALRAFANGVPHADVVEAQAKPRGRVAFVFSGESGQWLGMGRALLRDSTAFAAAAQACDEALRPVTGHSVLDVLAGDNALDFDRADVVQPALFTLHVALAAAWRAFGVEPDAVAGHGLGEVAAAVVAGTLTIEQGARIVALRSLLVRDRGGQAASMLITLPVAEVERQLGDELAVISVPTATSTVVSGDPAVVRRWQLALDTAGVPARVVDAGAVPGSRFDDVLPLMAAELAGPRPKPARIPFYSTTTGAPTDETYWCRNLREPVRLDRAVARLAEDGHDVFVEIGPHPALTDALAAAGGAVVPSLSRGNGGLTQLVRALGSLHANGYAVDWPRVLPGRPGASVAAPTYAFQRRRHPLPVTESAPAFGLVPTRHPWLRAATTLAGGDGWLLSGLLVLTEAMVPAAVVLELALAAARQAGAAGVASLSLTEPLTLPLALPLLVQVRVGPVTAGRCSIAVYGRWDQAREWARYAAGELAMTDAPGEWPAGAAGTEVRLPDSAAPGEFHLHPELLTAALRVGGETPVAWTDVRLRAGGATALRVGFAGDGLLATDLAGQPVLSVGKLG